MLSKTLTKRIAALFTTLAVVMCSACTDAFDTAYNTFRQVASLRAQSIRLQLDGQLSAVYEDQVPESRVDASDVDVMDMSRIV